jgi:hypothetical protein
MKKRIKYTDEPSDVDLDAALAVKDFLPPPDQLVFKEKTIKITLALSEDSVNFFKSPGRQTWPEISADDPQPD